MQEIRRNTLFDKQKLALDQARNALATGDLDALLDTFAPNASHRTLERRGWVTTPKSELKSLLVERMLGRQEPVWLRDQKRVRILNLSVGSVVVSAGVLTGTLGCGKPVAQPVLTIAEFDDDGKVADERLYYDMAAARGMGLGDFKGRRPADVPAFNPSWVVADGTAQESSNVSVVKAFFETMGRSDVDSSVHVMHEDVTYVDESFGLRVKGRSFLCSALSHLRRTFPDLAITVTGAWGAGRYVAVETRLSGTWREPCLRLGTPSNHPATVHSAQLIEADGGRIRRCTAYRSLAEMANALGVALRRGRNGQWRSAS